MSNIALQVQLSTTGTVANAANVVFDNVLYSNGNISYNAASGLVTFQQAGRYIVNWWVATQTSVAPGVISFALSSSQGDNILGTSPIKTGEISGIGIIDVPIAGVTMSLTNQTGYDVTYTTGPIIASMMIVEDTVGATGPTGPTGATGAYIKGKPTN